MLERLVTFQAADECLETPRNERDLVIPLLIDVDDAQLPAWPALPVIEADHIVPSGRAVGEVDANRWIPHSSIQKWLPKLPPSEWGFSRPIENIPWMAMCSLAHGVRSWVRWSHELFMRLQRTTGDENAAETW